MQAYISPAHRPLWRLLSPLIRTPPTSPVLWTPIRQASGPPEPPDEGSCCGNGCPDCVWVQYWEECADYERDQKIQAAQEEQQSQTSPSPPPAAPDPASLDPQMKAFLDMEKKLLQKRQKKAQPNDKKVHS